MLIRFIFEFETLIGQKGVSQTDICKYMVRCKNCNILKVKEKCNESHLLIQKDVEDFICYLMIHIPITW